MRFDEVERSGDIVIEARNLSKAFDVPLFRDLSLTVERGECMAVIGPNGAGKTTLDQDFDRPRKARLGRSRSSATRSRSAITTRACTRSIPTPRSFARSGPKTIPNGWKRTSVTCSPASA